MVYPPGNEVTEEWSFCDLLSASLCPQQTTPAWCDSCDKFSPTSQARILCSLPKILVINTGLHNTQYKRFWQTQMDNIVAKAVNMDGVRAQTPTTAVSSTKMCRYGANCARPNCRYRHGNALATVPQAPPNNLYYSNTWLPHQIFMTLDDKKTLRISQDDFDKSEKV